MTRKNEPNRRVKTAETAFEILETIRELDGARVTELANRLDLANSTVHDHVVTLEDLEYLTKNGQEYRLSLKMLDHGTWVKQDYTSLARLSRPVLEELAVETDQSAWLIVEEHGKGVYLEKAMGENAVQNDVRIGMREDIHALAAGKAILAHLPDAERDAIIDRQGLERHTNHTITDRDTLYDELKTIREQGFAMMDSELIEGLRAVGSVIIRSDEVLGAIAVVGPSTKIDDEYFESALPEMVMGGRNEIELKIKYEQTT